MADILSGCKTALQQGRYRWRHDKVLQTLADILETERRKKRPDLRHEKPAIQFVKAGEKAQTTASSQGGLLSGASTWEMRVDLNKRLVFPEVVHTS